MPATIASGIVIAFVVTIVVIFAVIFVVVVIIGDQLEIVLESGRFMPGMVESLVGIGNVVVVVVVVV